MIYATFSTQKKYRKTCVASKCVCVIEGLHDFVCSVWGMKSVADVSGRPASRRQHAHTDTAPFIQLSFSEISGRYAAQFVARHTGNIWPLLQPHTHTHTLIQTNT